MKVLGIDGGATKVSGGVVKKVNENIFRLVDPTIDIQYADHLNFNHNFSPLPLYTQSDEAISQEEEKQGSVMIDCTCEVIKSLAGDNPFQIAIAMPGIKTEDNRGILKMANGPRIPNFCDQIESKLKIKAPIQKLESDADMCVWGEEYAESGAFRSVNNAYYLGGGTGTADGLKLKGKLITFDEASDWIAKSIELKMQNGDSLENYASMSGIKQLRQSTSDGHIGNALGALLFDRISTIYSGWVKSYDVSRDLNQKHSFLGTLLDRIVIGQRLSQFLQSGEGQPIFNAMMEELTKQCADSHSEISDHFLIDGKFDLNRIVLSELRAAPIIGLGTKVWMTQC